MNEEPSEEFEEARSQKQETTQKTTVPSLQSPPSLTADQSKKNKSKSSSSPKNREALKRKVKAEEQGELFRKKRNINDSEKPTTNQHDKHSADFAARVMNIDSLDMTVLQPLFVWLDVTLLSSFDECIADLRELKMEGKKVFTKLPVYVSSVKKRVTQMMEGTESLKLSVDERAAIYLYTMVFPPLPDLKTNSSIHHLLNLYLRDPDRTALQPFLKYLKLLLSALYKLPAVKGKVCRGVKADIAADMKSKEKKEITWNSFSSTTLNSKTLDNPMFLGKEGTRALFYIDCKSGRNIAALSACPSEDEILLMPCTSFKVESVVVQGDLTTVNLTEVEPLEDFSALFIKSE